MSGFRLALLNPNTDERDTAAMAAAARAALGKPAEVIQLTAQAGARSIETATDDVTAAAETLRMARSVPDVDAYLVACFNDPAVNAVREITTAPVIGIGEAAYRAALLVARRFAVITTLPRGVPDLEETMERLGIRNRCVAVLAAGAVTPESTPTLIACGRHAVTELGAEALVLACGTLIDVESVVGEAVGVPVVTGVAFGALLAHALWRCGLHTSTVGSLAPPPRSALDALPAAGC